MSDLQRRLDEEVFHIRAVDCHSHIEVGSPHARGLADLLGYHYYTELAHSAGMPADAVDATRSEVDQITEMVARLETIDNTVQYGWLMEAVRDLFGFHYDRITRQNCMELNHAIAEAGKQEDRYRTVVARSNLEKVFLTNRFDEDLSTVDRTLFVPCLRTDDLVFQIGDPAVRERLAEKTGQEIDSLDDVRDAVQALFRYFVQNGAASAAISLPPSFEPTPPDESAAEKALGRALRNKELSADERAVLSAFVFDLVAEGCRHVQKPFQLMIGVLRNVYPGGVVGGRDLLSKMGSLIRYAGLFNRYPEVAFTVSTLSATWAHELATFAWIFPNVRPSGHWWYSNVPGQIEYELRSRLEAVPKGKLIGYYSDMYKVEFGLPKFNMYRRVLSRVLARDLVEPGRLTEGQAVELARLLLHDNPKRIFGV